MQLHFRRGGFALLLTAAVPAAIGIVSMRAEAQARPSHATSGAQGDAVVDGLKFHPVGGFIQVVDVANSVSAGTIILPPNQPPVFAAMPGYDARMRAAYEKYSGGGTTATAAAVAPAPSNETAPATTTPVPAAAASPAFDAANKTVTLSDGRTVSFVDKDNLEVHFSGNPVAKNYKLHFHAAGAGSALKSWAGSQQGRVGGSLGGGGVTITLESQGGMPGGDIYDTSQGTVYASSGFIQAKTVVAAVREATDFAKNNGQPDLAKLSVVKSLLSNNLGL